MPVPVPLPTVVAPTTAGPDDPERPGGPGDPPAGSGDPGDSPADQPPSRLRRAPRPDLVSASRLRIVPWTDPVADPLGVHPCSRYVELYWLGILGPSATWLLRRLSYGLDLHPRGFDLDLAETARCLGLGERLGRNSPFRRALLRLVVFELARPSAPSELAVRTHIPPLPLRHLTRLPASLQQSHRRWLAEQRLPPVEQMRRRADRLAAGLAAAGLDRTEIERRLTEWQFHPAVAYRAAERADDHATGPDPDGGARERSDPGGDAPGPGEGPAAGPDSEPGGE